MTRLPKQNGTTNFIDSCKVRKEVFCYVRAMVDGNWQFPSLVWQLTTRVPFQGFQFTFEEDNKTFMNNRDIMFIGHYEKMGN